ncbi:MAG: peptidase S41 [Marinibacterium sp.]
MSMIQDLTQVLTTVLPEDPSFRSVERDAIDRHIEAARKAAHANSRDEFLLSLMRLLALPGNGHTRLIPNDAISVVPLRFATIGAEVRLVDAVSGFREAIGGALISINRVSTDDVATAAESYLAGTPQRKRVIGPILFAWPGALQHLGIASGGVKIEYRIRSEMGQISDLRLDTAAEVAGSKFYPRGEHGRADASWAPSSFLQTEDFGQTGFLLVLPSFFDPGETALSDAVSKAADLVRSRPESPVLVDIRGNTGGDFLRTMPLIDALSEGPENRRVGVFVDKFTFSAAIVFVAILKHRLGKRLVLVGEEMGDGLKFFAEGGTLDLSCTGAAVRYSTAFHDWAGGRTDETTPPEIAARLVPVGTLNPDRIWVAKSDDVETWQRVCREVLDDLQS